MLVRMATDDERFIPARAGNARPSSAQGLLAAVHPRACGERSEKLLRPPTFYGSSPRVRGTLIAMIQKKEGQRFIPARAGNASRHIFRARALSVHPRACGERASKFPEIARTFGSSPRVRGTHHRQTCETRKRRFIPARAGNAPAVEPIRRQPAVHPRACGERARLRRGRALPSGSSPRVRGTHGHAGRHALL